MVPNDYRIESKLKFFPCFLFQHSSPRAVLCKSSRYPATLPRPALSVIPLMVPLCDTDTEKTAIEVGGLINMFTRSGNCNYL